MAKKARKGFFWIGLIVFLLALGYALPRFSRAPRIREDIQKEQAIVRDLDDSDAYHVQWHKDHIRRMETETEVATVVFWGGFVFLCLALYFFQRRT